VVKWTYFALLTAEEFGITQANVEEMKSSTNPEMKRILGIANEDGSAAGFGTGIGLPEDWVVNIVKAVGNYSEVFERNVGANTPLKISRGKNALWNAGGLQYAPPIR
jgi:general L-amino acid transport system substrate-binding protein